jgi:hypothetical protein
MGWKKKKKTTAQSNVKISDFSKFRWTKSKKIALLISVIFIIVLCAGVMYLSKSTKDHNGGSAQEEDSRRTACILSVQDSGSYEELISQTPQDQLSIARKNEIIKEISEKDYEKDFNCLYVLSILNLQVSNIDKAKEFFVLLKSELTEKDSIHPNLFMVGGSVNDLELAIEYAMKPVNESEANTFYCCDDDTERLEPGEDE